MTDIAKANIEVFLRNEYAKEPFEYDAYLLYGSGGWLESDTKAKLPTFKRESSVYKSTDKDVVFENRITEKLKEYLEPLKSMKSFRAIISVNGHIKVAVGQ